MIFLFLLRWLAHLEGPDEEEEEYEVGHKGREREEILKNNRVGVTGEEEREKERERCSFRLHNIHTRMVYVKDTFERYSFQETNKQLGVTEEEMLSRLVSMSC